MPLWAGTAKGGKALAGFIYVKALRQFCVMNFREPRAADKALAQKGI